MNQSEFRSNYILLIIEQTKGDIKASPLIVLTDGKHKNPTFILQRSYM